MEEHAITITISVDEYKSLIERATKAESSAEEYRSKYWEEAGKAIRLERSLLSFISKYGDKLNE